MRFIVLPLFVAILSVALPVRADERQPNLVLILTDDQGYEDIGCFGSKQIRTPRLDQLAQEGMRFTDFYSQPICGPARAALMTGCYPMRLAEANNLKHLHTIPHRLELTIAEYLQNEGYATACVGKWDLANHSQRAFYVDHLPTRQGFTYFFGTPSSNDSFVDLYRCEQHVESKADMGTLTQRYTDEVIEFIERSKGGPFFVYLAHTMPHTRLDASAEFKGRSARGLYGDVIEEIDHSVGQIVDALNELQIADHTYVLFTSDNGPWLIKNKEFADGSLPGDHGGSAGPLRSGKVSTWEGGQRVPMILWAPGRVPAGTTCRNLASTLDVLPTFAALAGAELQDDRIVDGEDIRHLFRGEFQQADPAKAYYFYFRTHLQAVRQGKWKLHLPRPKEPKWLQGFAVNAHIAPEDRVGFKKPFLVNLDQDIGETTSVADAHPEVVRRLLALAEEAPRPTSATTIELARTCGSSTGSRSGPRSHQLLPVAGEYNPSQRQRHVDYAQRQIYPRRSLR